MGDCMRFIIVSLVIGLFSNVYASDSWDSCSSADGYVRMDNGVLSIDGIGEIASESVNVTVLSTVKTEQELCMLKNYKTEVIAYDNTITVEEVEYTMEENDVQPSKVILICERGGSGIPANDECQ